MGNILISLAPTTGEHFSTCNTLLFYVLWVCKRLDSNLQPADGLTNTHNIKTGNSSFSCLKEFPLLLQIPHGVATALIYPVLRCPVNISAGTPTNHNQDFSWFSSLPPSYCYDSTSDQATQNQNTVLTQMSKNVHSKYSHTVLWFFGKIKQSRPSRKSLVRVSLKTLLCNSELKLTFPLLQYYSIQILH